MAEGIHKLKMGGQELDSRLDQVRTNEAQISVNAEAIEKNTAADAELKKKVDEIVIPTKVSEFENDSKYITDEALVDYAKKSDIPEISGAASPVDVDALKKQFAALSEYVLENTEAQVVDSIPEDGLTDLNYDSQNVIVKGHDAEDTLKVNCPISIVANSIVVKNVEFVEGASSIKLTA